MLLWRKQQFAHTWNLFKTITGAAGLKPIRLNLHIWTQDIWGERKTVQLDALWGAYWSRGRQIWRPCILLFKIESCVIVLLGEAISWKTLWGARRKRCEGLYCHRKQSSHWNTISRLIWTPPQLSDICGWEVNGWMTEDRDGSYRKREHPHIREAVTVLYFHTRVFQGWWWQPERQHLFHWQEELFFYDDGSSWEGHRLV